MKPLQEEQLQHIAQRILDTAHPLAIICYGSRSTEKKSWGTFLGEGAIINSVQSTYDLLVVTPNDSQSDHEVTDMIEQKFSAPIGINCLAKRLHYVQECLKAGSRFYHSILQQGRILYQVDGLDLPYDNQLPSICLTTDWNRWFKQSQHFYSLASHAFTCSWYAQAIFLLHQALEHACVALLRFFTGFHSNTHNIARLLMMTETFSLAPRAIFPGKTKEEEELLNLVNKAYTESRYNESYEVAPEKINVVRDRVKSFLLVADTLHKNGPRACDEPFVLYPMLANPLPAG